MLQNQKAEKLQQENLKKKLLNYQKIQTLEHRKDGCKNSDEDII